jgi:aminopeptidase N
MKNYIDLMLIKTKIDKIIIFLLLCLPLMAQPAANEREYRLTERGQFKNLTTFPAKSPTENQRQYDVISYQLNLDLFPENQHLDGAVTIHGRSLTNGLQQIEIDLYQNLSVNSVDQGGTQINFRHRNQLLTVYLISPLSEDEPFSLTVYYEGNPQESTYRSFGWSLHGQSVPIIWTLSEPYGSPAWWPCKDDPGDKADSVELNIGVPQGLIVASNGLLSGITTTTDGRPTYHWQTRYPIATYLVSLAISNYEIFSDRYDYSDSDSMELLFFVYPEHLEKARVDLGITSLMLKFYARIFGEYPFINEKYGMAIFPWGGGMEHQTITSYGAGLIQGNHRYDYINAHELAHQWFGDALTMRHWSHIWLNEGFASYAEALWFEEQNGKEFYQTYINNFDSPPLEGPLFVSDSLNENALFSRTVYDKGAFTLHMLRGVLGDSVFFRSLKQYASDRRFAYGNVTTEDFQLVCEEISGMSLSWFFQQWVYRGDRPLYEVLWSTSGTGPYTTIAQITQKNSMPFKMPVQIRLQDMVQDTSITIWDSLAYQQVEFETDFKPTDFLFDPLNWILKTVSIKQSEDDLRKTPKTFSIYQNYPNPFNPETRIPFTLPQEADVILEVYNVLGVRIYQENVKYPAGYHSFLWRGETNNGTAVPSGIYFYRLRTPSASATRRMILLR